MLLAPSTRIGLSQLDIRDFQSRYEARQSLRQTQVQLGGLRLSSTPSHLMRASITKAHDNPSRASADSHSSEATICSDNYRPYLPPSRSPPLQQDQLHIDGAYNNPLLDPGAPVFVPRPRFGSSSLSTDSNIDRYPPFRRPICPQRTSSRPHLEAYERTIRSHDDVRAQSSHRSSPNLLFPPSPPLHHAPRIRTRSSSLTWERSQENERQAPRMFSAASGISSNSSTAFPMDLLSRDSPLDELSQQLSRLASSTDRPRSVGRSFERTPGRERISLLSGNPFRVDSDPDITNVVRQGDGYRTLSPPSPVEAVKPNDRRDSIMDPRVLYELSLALPSPHMQQSSPASAGSRLPPLSPPQVWHARASSASLPDSTPKAAPHLAVYDDARSPGMQPQTPADISRSTARRHRPSPSVARQIDEEMVSSPLNTLSTQAGTRQISPLQGASSYSPSRLSVSQESARHTVLPEQRTSPLQQSFTPVQPQQRLSPRQQSATPSQHDGSYRSHRQSRSGNSENDIEPLLETVEEDRRTWTARREHGTLDVTPPAEGRYEMYFS